MDIDTAWVSAWGSWASGFGAVAAAVVALHVSWRDRRDRRTEREQEARYKQHFAAYQLSRYCDELKLKLEAMNIGNGVDETTWTVLQDLDKAVPSIVGLVNAADIPHVMYLGRLCEDGINLARNVADHNLACDKISDMRMVETPHEIYSGMRWRLIAVHTSANRLEHELEGLLNKHRDHPEFAIRLPRKRRGAFINPADLAPSEEDL